MSPKVGPQTRGRPGGLRAGGGVRVTPQSDSRVCEQDTLPPARYSARGELKWLAFGLPCATLATRLPLLLYGQCRPEKLANEVLSTNESPFP